MDFKVLVSAKEMLEKAKAGHYAVGQFNINNLEWTKAILETAPLFSVFPRGQASICVAIRPSLVWLTV